MFRHAFPLRAVRDGLCRGGRRRSSQYRLDWWRRSRRDRRRWSTGRTRERVGPSERHGGYVRLGQLRHARSLRASESRPVHLDGCRSSTRAGTRASAHLDRVLGRECAPMKQPDSHSTLPLGVAEAGALRRLSRTLGNPASVAVAVAVALALRLAVYLADRSLFIDEAFIALNVSRRSATGLTGVLSWNSAAPIGFLEIEKGLTALFGESEHVLQRRPSSPRSPRFCSLLLSPGAYSTPTQPRLLWLCSRASPSLPPTPR